MTESYYDSCRSPACFRPAWLRAALADLEQKMQALVFSASEQHNSDSFAERAENYYQKRPELLNLLQDLHMRYQSLADRYCQCIKQQAQSSSSLSHRDADDDVSLVLDQASDTESSISCQMPLRSRSKSSCPAADSVVSELVARTMDNYLLLNEVELLEKQHNESRKKIELQMNLIEVLESERLILMSENSRLGCRESALAEENKSLAAEASLLRTKASDLAKCLVKMRDDNSLCFLSSKIQDLQAQIYELEKRNKRYCEQMARREAEKRDVTKELYFQLERLKRENARMKEVANTRSVDDGGKVSKWLARLRKMDLMVACGPKSEWKR